MRSVLITLGHVLLLAVVGLTFGCASIPAESPRHRLGDRDFIQRLAPGVWRHVTYRDLPRWGPFPANGLIIKTPKGALVVDTTWTRSQAVQVVAWTERHVGAVLGVVVTHKHDDRDGGLAVFRDRRVPLFTRGSLRPLGLRGEVFFPGPAHAPDNVVVWLPATGVLFGGCVVRAQSAKNLGHTADADIPGWGPAVERLVERFGADAVLVVPGHGRPGGRSLLTHTAALAASAVGR